MNGQQQMPRWQQVLASGVGAGSFCYIFGGTLADAAAARGAQVALFGHTHIPLAETRGRVFLFNPGSCGRCYTGADTYGILTLADGKVVGHEHKEVPKA